MNRETERLVPEALEFLMARERVFLETEMTGDRQLLSSSISETKGCPLRGR